MELVLKTVGEVAGIAGISVAIFLLVVKGMLDRVSWPIPTKVQAFKLLNRMLWLAFTLAVIGVLSWLCSLALSATNKTIVSTVEKGGTIKLRMSLGSSSTSAFEASGQSESSGLAYLILEDWKAHVADELKFGEYKTEDRLTTYYLRNRNLMDSSGENEIFLKSKLNFYSEKKIPIKGYFIPSLYSKAECKDRYYSFIEKEHKTKTPYDEDAIKTREKLNNGEVAFSKLEHSLGEKNRVIAWIKTRIDIDEIIHSAELQHIYDINNVDTMSYRVSVHKNIENKIYNVSLVKVSLPCPATEMTP